MKTGKFDSSLEVVIMSSYTEVEISPKKFPIESATSTSLDEVNTISVNQLIKVSGKVTKVSNPSQVTSKIFNLLTKQDCILSLKDCSSTIRVVLWESDVGKLIEGTIYKFSKVLSTWWHEVCLSI